MSLERVCAAFYGVYDDTHAGKLAADDACVSYASILANQKTEDLAADEEFRQCCLSGCMLFELMGITCGAQKTPVSGEIVMRMYRWYQRHLLDPLRSIDQSLSQMLLSGGPIKTVELGGVIVLLTKLFVRGQFGLFAKYVTQLRLPASYRHAIEIIMRILNSLKLAEIHEEHGSNPFLHDLTHNDALDNLRIAIRNNQGILKKYFPMIVGIASSSQESSRNSLGAVCANDLETFIFALLWRNPNTDADTCPDLDHNSDYIVLLYSSWFDEHYEQIRNEQSAADVFCASALLRREFKVVLEILNNHENGIPPLVSFHAVDILSKHFNVYSDADRQQFLSSYRTWLGKQDTSGALQAIGVQYAEYAPGGFQVCDDPRVTKMKDFEAFEESIVGTQTDIYQRKGTVLWNSLSMEQISVDEYFKLVACLEALVDDDYMPAIEFLTNRMDPMFDKLQYENPANIPVKAANDITTPLGFAIYFLRVRGTLSKELNRPPNASQSETWKVVPDFATNAVRALVARVVPRTLLKDVIATLVAIVDAFGTKVVLPKPIKASLTQFLVKECFALRNASHLAFLEQDQYKKLDEWMESMNFNSFYGTI